MEAKYEKRYEIPLEEFKEKFGIQEHITSVVIWHNRNIIEVCVLENNELEQRLKKIREGDRT